MVKKVIIAGGGTGGHIFPAIAIANAILKQAPQTELLFVGAKGKMEMDKVPQAGYRIEGIDIAGFNRSSLIKNIGLPFKLLKSFVQVKKIMTCFQPDAVIGVGGYSTYPVLRYAQRKGIASFIHESNSFAGKSNRLLGKRATMIFCASDGMENFFPKDKIKVTGNPVRKNILDTGVSRAEALTFFGLKENRTTVLSMGGSLGARSINEALALHLEAFADNQLQLIWQTGKTTAAQYKAVGQGKPGVWVNDFITEMGKAYAAADIVISRSGAMSVAELCVTKKPVVLVPYPFAAEDHQTANALNLVQKQAALMVKDQEVKEKLVDTVILLSKDLQRQQLLKQNMASLAIANADEVIAAAILNYIQ